MNHDKQKIFFRRNKLKYKGRYHPSELSLDGVSWYQDREIMKMLDEKQQKPYAVLDYYNSFSYDTDSDDSDIGCANVPGKCRKFLSTVVNPLRSKGKRPRVSIRKKIVKLS